MLNVYPLINVTSKRFYYALSFFLSAGTVMFILFLFYLSFSIPLHAQETRRRVSLLRDFEIVSGERQPERNAIRPLSYSSRATNGFFDKYIYYLLIIRREDFATRNKITHSFSLLFEKSL